MLYYSCIQNNAVGAKPDTHIKDQKVKNELRRCNMRKSVSVKLFVEWGEPDYYAYLLYYPLKYSIE